jgi:hypothetical protein
MELIPIKGKVAVHIEKIEEVCFMRHEKIEYLLSRLEIFRQRVPYGTKDIQMIMI